MFQFTHPGRGATEFHRSMLIRGGFQFTHPGRGATISEQEEMIIRLFQFTHPGRGATQALGKVHKEVEVSIHAPREGCDSLVTLNSLKKIWFQFTHPGRGATY